MALPAGAVICRCRGRAVITKIEFEIERHPDCDPVPAVNGYAISSKPDDPAVGGGGG